MGRSHRGLLAMASSPWALPPTHSEPWRYFHCGVWIGYEYPTSAIKKPSNKNRGQQLASPLVYRMDEYHSQSAPAEDDEHFLNGFEEGAIAVFVLADQLVFEWQNEAMKVNVEDADQGRQVEAHAEVLSSSGVALLLLVDLAKDLFEIGLHPEELGRFLDLEGRLDVFFGA